MLDVDLHGVENKKCGLDPIFVYVGGLGFLNLWWLC